MIVSLFFSVALVRMCDCQKESADGMQDGAGARAVWDQLLSRARSQGHSTRGPEDAVPAKPSSESSPVSSHNAAVATPPRGDGSAPEVNPARMAGDATQARGAVRSPRQLGTHQSSQPRARIGSRQANKHSSSKTRRLVG